jgi:hypothetical protein
MDKPDRHHSRRSVLRAAPSLALLAALPAGASHAQKPRAPGAPAVDYETPGLRLAFTAWVEIAPLRSIGAIPGGEGRIVPIAGGTFEGPRLRGKVMPGGADWQTIRPDGVTELHAHYGLETSDGAIIQVWNNVIGRNDPPLAGQTTPVRFLRSSIKLEAPKGPHDWLNKSVFVGTLNAPADPRAPVTIRCFELI